MKRVAVEDLGETFGAWLDQQLDGAVVITRNGETIGLFTTVDEFDLEAFSLSRNPVFWEIIEHSRARQKIEGSLTVDEVCRELGLSFEDISQTSSEPCNRK